MIMDDPDAPNGTFTHWVVFNLPASSTGIANGRIPAGAAQAQNGRGQAAYTGPCPPSGTHHYRAGLSQIAGTAGQPVKRACFPDNVQSGRSAPPAP
jgi:Raf kinase inhibitor-like YbhB/YbcL family protein